MRTLKHIVLSLINEDSRKLFNLNKVCSGYIFQSRTVCVYYDFFIGQFLLDVFTPKLINEFYIDFNKNTKNNPYFDDDMALIHNGTSNEEIGKYYVLLGEYIQEFIDDAKIIQEKERLEDKFPERGIKTKKEKL